MRGQPKSPDRYAPEKLFWKIILEKFDHVGQDRGQDKQKAARVGRSRSRWVPLQIGTASLHPSDAVSLHPGGVACAADCAPVRPYPSQGDALCGLLLTGPRMQRAWKM